MARFTEAERVEVWERRQRGEGNRSIGRRLGRSAGSIRAFVESTGGVRTGGSATFATSFVVDGARGDLERDSCRRTFVCHR